MKGGVGGCRAWYTSMVSPPCSVVVAHRRQEAPVTSLAPASNPSAIDQQALSVGRRIRELRRGRGLTLVQLAARASLSHPFLSQLERGLARPSMVSLERIARALGSSQVEILAAVDDDAARDALGQRQPGTVFVRAGEGSRGSYGQAEARLLVHGTRRFHPMEVRGANADPGDYLSHAEDEFVHVVDGTVLIDLDGDETRILVPGDSIYYTGGTPHRWSALDEGGYRLFVVKEKPAVL